MQTIDWKIRASNALQRIGEDRWAYPASKYLAIVDDVCSGKLDADAIQVKHGSMDVVISALYHITKVVHGKGKRLSIEEGGWCEPKLHNGRYVVAPGFAAAWHAARAKPI